MSVDAVAGSVVLHVDKANKWGRSLKGTDVTFTVATVKKIGVADTNGDGKRDLADVVAGDKAQAQAKVVKDAPQPFAARKLKVYVPETAETEGTESGLAPLGDRLDGRPHFVQRAAGPACQVGRQRRREALAGVSGDPGRRQQELGVGVAERLHPERAGDLVGELASGHRPDGSVRRAP